MEPQANSLWLWKIPSKEWNPNGVHAFFVFLSSGWLTPTRDSVGTLCDTHRSHLHSGYPRGACVLLHISCLRIVSVISANTISLGMRISSASNWKEIHNNNVSYFLTWFWEQKMVLVFAVARVTANASRGSLPVWRWLKKLTAQKQAAFLFKSYTPVLLSVVVLVEDITSSAEPMTYSCVSIYRSPSKDKLNSVAVPWKLMLWTHSFFLWKLVFPRHLLFGILFTTSLMISNPMCPSLFCGFKFFTVLISVSPYEKAISVSQMRKLLVKQPIYRGPPWAWHKLL